MMPSQEQLRTEPYCSKGCKHVYDHEKTCSRPKDYEPAVDPEKYEGLDAESLIETYDHLHADFARYGRDPIDWNSKYREYHRPTYMEAARRLGLAKAEIIKRMKVGPA